MIATLQVTRRLDPLAFTPVRVWLSPILFCQALIIERKQKRCEARFTYGAATLADSLESVVDLEQVAVRREDGQRAIIRASHGRRS